MKKINLKLEEISIAAYCKMLRDGEDTKEIEMELSKALGSLGGGFDLALFMLQKDLLLFQCKLAKGIFSFDESQRTFYEKKIKELKAEIERKTAKKEKANPYKSFLSWILAVEKYLGFSIDRENDLLYLSEATRQMLNFYDQQKKQIDEQNAKRK